MAVPTDMDMDMDREVEMEMDTVKVAFCWQLATLLNIQKLFLSPPCELSPLSLLRNAL